MAYDKIVDSAALDGALTDIADAIRGKTGSTELLTIDQMAAAISGIQTGNGELPGGGGMSGIYMAQVTPTQNVTTLTIEHGLGTTDILMAAVFAETLGDFVPERDGTLAHLWAKMDMPMLRGGVGYDMIFGWNTRNQAATYSMAQDASSFIRFPTANTAVCSAMSHTPTTQWFAGLTYTVIIIAASAFVPTEV